MTFLDKLQSHKGGLILLKTELYWYDGRGYDNTPGRICLILDAAAPAVAAPTSAVVATTAAPRIAPTSARRSTATAPTAAAILLIEGQPQWIWLAEQDIDILVNDTPTN